MNEHERPPLPRVREVLLLPEVRLGEPEIVAGARGEDREVRWAHVFAGSEAAELLDGGELVLTTGAGWPQDDAALERLAHELVTTGGVGAAAILFELGTGFQQAPAALIRNCEQNGIPLVLLHRQVRFVQITQRVHQRILTAQTEALRARDEVHTMLTELGLNRSPVDYVVERLSATLDAPVVLEDSAGRVVAFTALGRNPAEVLTLWQDGRAPQLPAAAARVPVEARGRRWGQLTALPGPPHPAGRRTVLELGAFALALGRLADSNDDQWLHFTSKRVFDALLGGRYRNDTELTAQLAAAGLPIAGRAILALTLQGADDFGAHPSLEHATLETALRRAVAPEGRTLITENGDRALLALVSLPQGDERILRSDNGSAPALAMRLARELEMLVPEPTPPAWRAHLTLSTPGYRLRQLVPSIEQLRTTGRMEATAEVGRVTVQETERQPLAHLVRVLAAAPELQQFTSDLLTPLIEHDATSGFGHSGDLHRVLSAYLTHPTNRSLAAKEAMLSRSVFYQRLELIESLLGMDLSEGETIAALTVALHARAR